MPQPKRENEWKSQPTTRAYRKTHAKLSLLHYYSGEIMELFSKMLCHYIDKIKTNKYKEIIRSLRSFLNRRRN